MSSPKVLTAVMLPAKVAQARNREDIQHYFQLAREVLKQIEEMEQKTLAVGGAPLHRDVIPLRKAEAEAWRRFLQDGFAATEYAHAYWQSLKHPWQERVVRRYSEALAEQAKQQQEEEAERRQENEEAVRRREEAQAKSQWEEAQDLENIAAQIRTEFRSAQEFTLQQIDASDCLPVFSLPQQIAADKAAIFLSVDATKRATVEAQMQQWEGLDLQRQSIALEALRLTLEQQAKQGRTAEAVRIYQESQRQLIAERMEWRLSRCGVRMKDLEAAQAEQLQAGLAQFQSALANGEISAEREDYLQELEERIIEATRRQGLLEAAITSLRRQGYEKIEVSQVIGPPPLTSVYLHDAHDPERVALVQACEEKGLLSAEIVRRRSSNGSQQDRSQDREAQARLCRAMEAAEVALAEKWDCSVLKNESPGIPPEIKTDIPVKGKMTHHPGATQQRTLG